MALDIRQDVVLADGTALEDCFDLEARKIAGRVFADPEIHRIELDRVFARTWNFVGFECEVPAPGDYVTRLMGGDSVIVTRDKAGAVNVLLNSCTHRGTQLSVIDQGNCDRFKCPYHGWVFGLGGGLEAMVAERDRLGPNDCKDAFNLRRARVETYAGLIFATWNEEGPDLETYLGDARWYFDVLFKSVDDDLVVVGPPQRWTIATNWKTGAENFSGDAYHAPTTHAVASDIGLVPAGFLGGVLSAAQVADTTYGHGMIIFNLPRMAAGMELSDDLLRQFEFPWLPPEVLPQVDKNLSADQLRMLRNGDFPGVGNLFPNCSWVMQATMGGPLCTLRTWNPVGPNHVELCSWVITHPAASEELRTVTATGYAQQFGISGMFEQDDLAIWSRIQRARQGAMGGRQDVDYSSGRVPNKTNQMSDACDWPGPGTVWESRGGAGAVADDAMWQFFLRWYALMTEA